MAKCAGDSGAPLPLHGFRETVGRTGRASRPPHGRVPAFQVPRSRRMDSRSGQG